MEDSIRRAEAYRQYHNDPVFREPWDKVRAAFVARWQSTLPGDYDTRETIYKFLGLMDKLDAFVGNVIASGEIDKARLETLVTLQKAHDSDA